VVRRLEGVSMGNDEVKGWGKYGTTDRLLQAFDAGPFPAVYVEPWPPALVELVTRQTGRRFDDLASFLAEYERAKAFLGHEAVQLTPALIHQQWLSDPNPVHAAKEPLRIHQIRTIDSTVVAAVSPSDGVFDPNDLGD